MPGNNLRLGAGPPAGAGGGYAGFGAPGGSKAAAAPAPGATEEGQPWVEKYRPERVEEVCHQGEVVEALKSAVQGKDLPHLLFYGPPGTGKTTTALAITRQLFGPELKKQRVLELNASDERGIQVVREKIKSFASLAVGHGVSGYPCPPFKVIILDESDFMTKDAQNALRRIIEQYSKTTRFVFCCNYITRIIEPLTSRCAKFRFKPVVLESLTERIQHICDREGLTLEGGAMAALARVANGDMRRAITLLQSAARFNSNVLDVEALYEAAGVVPDTEIESLLQVCMKSGFSDVERRVKEMIYDSFPLSQILLQFQEAVVGAEGVEDLVKAEICQKFAEVDKRISDGANEELQLLDAVGFAHQAFAKARG
ncbi:subunit 4 of replication factor C [Chloropicon primus]|uniref:Subunit 4 of replication factor C n=1 Tax=Chloropicon primus TaxID=1764295 RepID=A0A5B8MTD2_9CHLO|nr:subunit 4 of replication factor C [Chloropicon primus]UPR01904.1 subunit 4 of replication factor C [Chloropicon primus]|eukprot:QDZ22680.1 subunit 4 of replication factor C [Chloropicon primus]